MIERLALAGIVLLGSVIALAGTPVLGNEAVAQASTPTPPVIIPAWIAGGGNFYSCCNDVDPGATPDKHLFAGVIDAGATPSASLGLNCPGAGAPGNFE